LRTNLRAEYLPIRSRWRYSESSTVGRIYM